MPIKTSSAKGKSRRLPQWVRDCILAAYPKLDVSDVISTSMGAGGEDVRLSKAARDVFPYSVECKSLATVSAKNISIRQSVIVLSELNRCW